MIINPVVFFLAVLGVYGVYYLVMHLKSKGAVSIKAQEKVLETV